MIQLDWQFRRRRRLGETKFGCEVELAATPLFTIDPDPTAHHPDQLRRDRQPETGAAIFASCRYIDLRERFEQDFGLSFGNANPGVSNTKMQSDGFFGFRFRSNIQYNLALVSELHRVSDQIDDDLPQPTGIAHERLGNLGRYMA